MAWTCFQPGPADFQWQLREAEGEISYLCSEMKLTEVQLSLNPASFPSQVLRVHLQALMLFCLISWVAIEQPLGIKRAQG